VLIALLADSADDPEMHRRVLEDLLEPSLQPVAEVLGAAQERGELRAGLDLKDAVGIFGGLIAARALSLSPARSQPDDAQRAVHIVLAGIAADTEES
jgi:hypothetical protein